MTRALTLSADARREIDAAIREIVDDKGQKAVDRLCAMRGHLASPDVKAKRKTELAQLKAMNARLERELAAAKAALAAAPAAPVVREDARTVRSFPKPLPRVADRDLLDEFRQANPTCCVRHCGRDAHPHHLIERSDHGSDAHENLIPLCVHHHTGREGWHTLTPDVWVPKYNARLPRTAQIKIALAMETLAERRGDVIDAGAAS